MSLQEDKIRWFQNTKLYLAFAIIAIQVATALVISLDWQTVKQLNPVTIGLLALGAFVLLSVAFGLLQNYLKPPTSTVADTASANDISDDGVWDDLAVDGRLLMIEADIQALKMDGLMPTIDKQLLVEQISRTIKDELAQEAESIVDFKRSDKALTLRRNTILTRYKASIERLLAEIKSVRSTGIVNLLIGIIVAAAGVTTLAIVVLNAPAVKMEGIEYAVYFIPKVTLAFVIQVFSYFFLSLYKKAHAEIKSLHNEITNIDMKYMALRAAIDFPEKPVYDDAIRDILKTERNSTLKKGETTIELELAKLEDSYISNFVKHVASNADVFKRKNAKKKSTPEG